MPETRLEGRAFPTGCAPAAGASVDPEKACRPLRTDANPPSRAPRSPIARPDVKGRRLGLREPTAEEEALERGQARRVIRVGRTRLGLERTNVYRRARGLRTIECEPAPLGDDIERLDANVPLPSAPEVKVVLDGELPDAVDNSQLKYFPPIGDQGELNSCAQWAAIYYAATYMYASARDLDVRSGGHASRFSPRFTYNMLNGGSNGGTSYVAGFNVAIRHGLATWAEFPYLKDSSPATSYRAWCLEPAVWRAAIDRRFSEYGYVADTDTETGIETVKEMLNNGYVLNISTHAHGWQFRRVGNDPATSSDNALAGQWSIFWVNDDSGGHAMTVVGYNDHLWVDVNGNGRVDSREKGCFKVANSWGSGWGNGGFVWMAYDALRNASAVSGGPGSGREPAWYNRRAYYVLPRVGYRPQVIARFTLEHAARNHLKVFLGTGSTSQSQPAKYWWSAPFVLSNGGGSYSFAGSGGTVPGTFFFDFTDILPEEGLTSRWYVGMQDTVEGTPGAISDFTLYRTGAEGDEEVGNWTGIKTADNRTQYVHVDWVLHTRRVWYVSHDAAGRGDGTSWTDAFNDLQSALDAAREGHRIWVAAGTYRPSTGTDRAASFTMKPGVAIRGGFAGTETAVDERDPQVNVTVLSGDIGTADQSSDNSYHVVTGANDATLDGFTVTGGQADGAGNDAHGAGILCLDASPLITRCRIEENCADLRGGGIYASGGAPRLESCRMTGNSATAGGAIATAGSSSLSAVNAVISFNTASYAGGAVANDESSDLTLQLCSLTRNSADAAGGLGNTGAATATVANSILWDNPGGEVYNDAVLSVTYSCVRGGHAGTGNIASDPLFADVAGCDLHLQSPAGRWDGTAWTITDSAASPCLDAGDPGQSAANETLPNGERVNMGAFGNTAQASRSHTAVIHVAMTADLAAGSAPPDAEPDSAERCGRDSEELVVPPEDALQEVILEVF